MRPWATKIRPGQKVLYRGERYTVIRSRTQNRPWKPKKGKPTVKGTWTWMTLEGGIFLLCLPCQRFEV